MPSAPAPTRNILNTQDVLRWLNEIADDRLMDIAEERSQKTRQWLLIVARKWILREGSTESIRAGATNSAEFPEWAKKSINEGSAVDRLLFTREERDKLAQIVDWLRAPDGPSLRTDWTRIGVDQALKSEQQWVADNIRATERMLAAKKDQDVDAEGVSTVLSLDNGWRWVKVLSKDSLDREGALMRHCVGSYANLVAQGAVDIWSLRDSDNQPHVTIETRGEELRQLKGFANAYMRAEFASATAVFLRYFENEQKAAAVAKGAYFAGLPISEDLAAGHFFRQPGGELRHGADVSAEERRDFADAISGDPKKMERWGLSSFALGAQKIRVAAIDVDLAQKEREATESQTSITDDIDVTNHDFEEKTSRATISRFFGRSERELAEQMKLLAEAIMINIENDHSVEAFEQQRQIASYVSEARLMAEHSHFIYFPKAGLTHFTELTPADRASFASALDGDKRRAIFWDWPVKEDWLKKPFIEREKSMLKASGVGLDMIRGSAQDEFAVSEALRDQVIDYFAKHFDDCESINTKEAWEVAWLSAIFFQNNDALSCSAIKRLEERWANDPLFCGHVIALSVSDFLVKDIGVSQNAFNKAAAFVEKLGPGNGVENNRAPRCVISQAIASKQFALASDALNNRILPIENRSIENALEINTQESRAIAKQAIELLIDHADQNSTLPDFEKPNSTYVQGLATQVAAWVVRQSATDKEALNFFRPFAPYMSHIFWKTKDAEKLMEMDSSLPIGFSVRKPRFLSATRLVEEWRNKRKESKNAKENIDQNGPGANRAQK